MGAAKFVKAMAAVVLFNGALFLCVREEAIAGEKEELAKKYTEQLRKTKDAKARITALQELGTLAQLKKSLAADALPDIYKAAEDKDAGVRAAAAETLGKADEPYEKAGTILVKLLKDDKDESVKIGAIKGLTAMGSNAKSALSTLRKSPKLPTRRVSSVKPQSTRLNPSVERRTERFPNASARSCAFLGTAAMATVGSYSPLALSVDSPRTKPPLRAKPATKKIAVVASIYHYLSHAYHIAGRFLDGYMKGDEHHFPEFGVASAYVEQVKANDLSRELAKEHGFRLSETIEDALTLGTGKLAVDGVLLICEHGDYPYNAKGQKLYPRHEYFQKIVEVFEKSGKTRAGVLRQAPQLRPHEGRRDGRDREEDGVPADGRVVAAGHVAAAGIGVPARHEDDGGAASRRAANWRSTASTRSKRCSAWSSAGSRTPTRSPATGREGGHVLCKATRCGRPATTGCGRGSCSNTRSAGVTSRNAGDIRENCRRFPRPATWGNFVKGPIAFLVEYATA